MATALRVIVSAGISCRAPSRPLGWPSLLLSGGATRPRRGRLLVRSTRGKLHDVVFHAPAGIAGELDDAKTGAGHEYLSRPSYFVGRHVQLNRQAVDAVTGRSTGA
jgi:hypothetical protein